MIRRKEGKWERRERGGWGKDQRKEKRGRDAEAKEGGGTQISVTQACALDVLASVTVDCLSYSL